MKKVLILLVTALLLGNYSAVQAQSYNTSVGFRLGPSYGFSIKHFFNHNLAFEGLVTSHYWGVAGSPSLNFTGLVTWHFPIGRRTGFEWFIGGGAHAGYQLLNNGGGFGVLVNEGDKPGVFLMGLDVMGGVQYTFPNIPLTLQADYKPAVNFFEQTNFVMYEIGVTARYTF